MLILEFFFLPPPLPHLSFFFFFNDTAPPEIYPFSLPDPFPIYVRQLRLHQLDLPRRGWRRPLDQRKLGVAHLGRERANNPHRWGVQAAGPHNHSHPRSEEHTSELQSQSNLVCRLLLEKKKAMAKAGKGLLEGTLQAGTSAVSDKLLDLVGLGGKSAADKGKDNRDYLADEFPELNAWECAGADATSAGMIDAGFENQKELIKMQLYNHFFFK